MERDSNLGEDLFLLQVEWVRGEIRTKFASAHQLLVERETELLSELQQLEERYRGTAVTEQIVELHRLKNENLANVKRNENKDLVMQYISNLENRVEKLGNELEKTRASMSNIIFVWDGQFEIGMSEIGAIKLLHDLEYSEKGIPRIVACKHMYEKSSSPGVFCGPRSVAIDPATSNIFICDWGNDRVQVFDKYLEYMFDFDELMAGPFGICVNDGKVYVTQYWRNCLNVYKANTKLLKSVGGKGEAKLEFNQPCGVGISTNTNLIYVCDRGNKRIQCLNLDFTFNSTISDIPEPRDVELTTSEIIVLTGGKDFIRCYNYMRQFVRFVNPYGKMEEITIDSWHFCIDKLGHILATSYDGHYVYILTSDGEIIRRFGRKGEGKGEFLEPTGIALDSECNIIVISKNSMNCLQIF